MVILSHNGTVLFSRDGQLTEPEIKKAIAIIWKELGGKEVVAGE